MKPFIPDRVLYEPAILAYPLGATLYKQYKQLGLPMETIESHNRIPDMQKQPNSAFPKMKRCLVMGIRKTHRYTDNHKVSDYLAPYTSSGCTAMCMYCYLVCNYNKCAYLRLFVNREEMLEKMIKKANSFTDDKVFEIGSNSDMVLENTITGNLVWTIENFVRQPKGKLTFPTKFNMIDNILGLDHQNRIIPRVSVNPGYLIQHTEFGTASLAERINAINQLVEAGYPVGILIAPVILVENWQDLYTQLVGQLKELLSPKARKMVFFEIILMTYSYVHNKINEEAFPNAIPIYDKTLMTGRGRGKYWYKDNIREEAKNTLHTLVSAAFPENKILYIV